ncbi:hypothetical protein EVAR_83489_1 [Eumeta japonica]|uniref:Uncharacterized protein n=1 Tax=Eumeta variegata TaxID=151549 RepID=A0A4C1ZJ02_EUMVA|nr:hypothetical protein EVAR_83489_1 [Eumeta japonica]
MIDFVILDGRLRDKNVDTAVYSGINVGKYHFLVVCRIKALNQRWRHNAKMATTELEQRKRKYENLIKPTLILSHKRFLELNNLSSAVAAGAVTGYRGLRAPAPRGPSGRGSRCRLAATAHRRYPDSYIAVVTSSTCSTRHSALSRVTRTKRPAHSSRARVRTRIEVQPARKTRASNGFVCKL